MLGPPTRFTRSFFSRKKCLPPEVTKAKSIEIWGNRILRIKIYFLQNKFILKEGKFPFTLFLELQKQKMTRAFQNQGNSYVTRMDIRFIPDNIAVLD